MKSGTLRSITIVVLFSALALPVRLLAQDDTHNPTFITFDVSGAGTGTATVVELNPSILYLECRKPCPPPWQSATLTNKGNTPLTISSIGIKPNPGGISFSFGEGNNCPRTLGRNQFCSIWVYCNPPPLPHMPSVGSAAVSVNDNGVGSPQQLTVVCIRLPTF